MNQSETMPCMAAVMTTRALAGAIIRDERARSHLTQERAAQMWGISRITLARLEAGVETVGDQPYRYVEGGLGLPRRFFAYVLEGDRERISRLPGLPDDLRQYVTEAIEDVTGTRRRRATDER